MHQLQGLGDEFDIDQSARRIFQIPAIAAGILRRHLLAHVARIGEDLGGVAALAVRRRRISAFDPRRASSGGPATSRARVSAICSQVQLSLA